MTNIVMIAKGREKLTDQAVASIFNNTPADYFRLTLVDDGSEPPVTTPAVCLRISKSRGIVGLARNIGAMFAEQYWGPTEYVCFLDNDVAVFPGWLERFIGMLDWPRQDNPSRGYEILGGCQHPYHGTNSWIKATAGDTGEIHITDAVAGYSLFMRWDTWKKYGPFPANQPGTGASEDYALCRRVVDDGGLVGYVHPPVLTHCGITNTDGKPATGAEHFERVPGVLYL